MNNLTIRKKLILLSSIVLVVIFAYSLKIGLDSYNSYVNDNETHDIIELSVKMSSVLHELQKERGASAGFIGSGGKKFADILPLQQKETDKRIAELREFCSKYPMTYATDTFHVGASGSCDSNVDCTTDNCDTNAVDVVPSTTLDDNTNCNPFFNFNPNATANTPYGANLPTVGGVPYEDTFTYQVSGDKIFTSFKCGQVEMSYLAFPVDEKGLPMIPQETRFQNAVRDYIAHRLSFKLSIQGKFPANMAEKLEQNWLFYCQSAANKSRMPSIDQMESLKNQWLRSIPKINEHDSSFRYQHVEERRYTINSR